MAFESLERRHLLTTPGIGPSVVDRLESMGIDSIARLRELGVDEVVQRICQLQGNPAWRNRLAALRRALHAA